EPPTRRPASPGRCRPAPRPARPAGPAAPPAGRRFRRARAGG
ncbi:MAG: sugar ABC transporter permease, partial [Planctomycetes bacterium]|nr:sugar ABC transporter permease [Planctomycetota bacterium]